MKTSAFVLDVYENALSQLQCDALIAAFGAQLQPSTINRGLSSAHRTGSSLKLPASAVPQELIDRVVVRTGRPSSHREPWELLRYQRGEQYALHHDCVNMQNPREFSVLLYLRAPQAGGATSFPYAGRTIVPAIGTMLIWNNTDSRGQRLTAAAHCAEPVELGEKWALVTWVCARSLG